MAKSIRIEDIAKLADVSTATVSRVLSDFPGVNPETRSKVQKIMNEAGYQPNVAAQNLARLGSKGTSKTIGLFVSDTRNPLFGDLIYRMQKELFDYGYLVTAFSCEFDCDLEMQYLRMAKEHGLASLILVSSMDNAQLKKELEGYDRPITLIDRVIEGFACNIVIQDNFQAGYIAAKHLVDLKHHEISFIAGNTNSNSSMLRLEGYKKAMKTAFLNVNESFIAMGEMGVKRGYEEGIKYIQNLKSLPKAVIIANDMTAIGFLEACKERSVRVPEDISIVSFDDIALSSLKSIALTTVRQPVAEMCKCVAKVTVDAINHPEEIQDQRILLEPTLIIRNSTCENKG